LRDGFGGIRQRTRGDIAQRQLVLLINSHVSLLGRFVANVMRKKAKRWWCRLTGGSTGYSHQDQFVIPRRPESSEHIFTAQQTTVVFVRYAG
jgi:hypothetical protein